MSMLIRNTLLFRLIWISLIVAGTLCIQVTADTQKNSTTLMGIYMVGGDLESEDGFGTEDIVQMIDGYHDADPDALTLLIAYGGAYTPEWSGMTIADIQDLKIDIRDGIIGNDDHYLYRDRDANMGDGQSLSRFLSYLKDIPSEQAFLIFWDHGDSYNGFGYDENYADQLTIDEMTGALDENDREYDLIGFDACLMGTLEVSSRFVPYTRYFLASEEEEPAEGWDYEKIIHSLMQTPSPDPVIFGETVIDSFMQESEGDSTLSLLDLSKTPLLLTQLDILGSRLLLLAEDPAHYAGVGSAYKKTKAFGSIPREQTEYSLDLANLLQNIQNAVPEARNEVQNVTNVLPLFVIFEKHTDISPNISGIAIASPRFLDSTSYTPLADSISLTEGWDRFFTTYITKKDSETAKPEFVEEAAGTYDLNDTYATADVVIDYYAFDEEGITILGSDPVFPDANGSYHLPEWNGVWYFLNNPDDEGEYTLLEMYFIEENPDGSLVYSSDIDIEHNGETDMAIMNIVIKPDTGEITTSILPYTVRGDGEILFARKTIVPQPGDVITTYASYLADDSEEEELIKVGEITVTNGTQVTYAVLPDGIYAYGLYAEYYNGEGDYSDIQVLEISGLDVIPLSTDGWSDSTGSVDESGYTDIGEYEDVKQDEEIALNDPFPIYKEETDTYG